MIMHDVQQNSPEWFAARVGVITASNFGRIITPKTMVLSASASAIENRIVAEILTGESIEEFQGNQYTDRGHILEPDAVSFYELTTGTETQKVGFITNDDGAVGCSPDRLIGEDGGLEIKCLSSPKHVEFVLSGKIDEEHKAQIQGCLMITGRKWWDVMAYHPEIKPSIVRVTPDEEYISKLAVAIKTMLSNIQHKLERLK